jgi:RecB family exonuclease
MRGIDALDVVATESRLASGFHERIHNLWPGLEEERVGEPSPPPVVAVPENAEPTAPWFVSRDREEELVRVVRWLKARAASAHYSMALPPLDRIALVFQRPLPYLYLARQVFPDGGLPYETVDTLPLSGEPFAAAVDQVLSFLGSEANRTSLLELLRSPHFVFGSRLERGDVLALDDWLRDLKYAGGWGRLEQLDSGHPAIARALVQARAAAQASAAVLTSAAASEQFDALLAFLRTCERLPDPEMEMASGHLRARAAVFAALHALREAHAKHDDQPLDLVELSGTIRRWIDAQTFAPRTGEPGVWLLDAVSAPYADVDELHLLGLVERDWPEPPRRSIFYPSSILGNLGWPPDAARMVAARAMFQDLLWVPNVRVAASVFTLEDDAIVAPSPMLEEIESSGLTLERWPALPAMSVFTHEAVQLGDHEIVAQIAPGAPVTEWLNLRRSRTAASDLQFKGMAGLREPQTYAISYLERYLECPFKYFANRILRLPEERDEESGLSAIERGHFIHDVFETFFRDWQSGGGAAITIENVADALTLFEEIAERKLDKLPEADRALERNHLLGSAAASGLAERAFAFEIEQGGEVLERLLEHELEGEYEFAGPGGPRRVRIRSKADRLDLMADGTIRVIDYKTGKAPKASKALQLSIYGVIARQELAGRHGRSWSVGSAGYIAFKERDAFVPMGGRMSLQDALADGQARLLKAVDGIERGEFPVDPEEPFRCQWCGYAAVCRKDYVGDE